MRDLRRPWALLVVRRTVPCASRRVLVRRNMQTKRRSVDADHPHRGLRVSCREQAAPGAGCYNDFSARCRGVRFGCVAGQARAGGFAAPGRWEPSWTDRALDIRAGYYGLHGNSRLRMRETFAALPWEECGPRFALVTYTYPRVFTSDGREVVRHREAMKERWRKAWGAPKGAWVLEFQKRGAPHTHTFVGLPDVEPQAFDDWVLRCWFEVVGSGDRQHLNRGVDIERSFGGSARSNARRVAEYFWREAGKMEQKEVPPEYTDVGRFWGYWGLKPQKERLAIAVHEYARSAA